MKQSLTRTAARIRRRSAALVAATLAGALVLGGCGIPDNTEIVQIGSGPSRGFASGDDAAPPRHDRTSTTDTAEFVKHYLEAAGGDPDGALARVKSFLSPSAATTFRASNEIKIVHLAEDPLVNPGSDEVTLKVRTVGVLVHNGVLDPKPDRGVETLTLTVKTITDQTGLYVTKPPPGLLLSDDALNTYFERRTIYFWNQDHTALVPDVRYLPRDMPSEQEPQQIIKWLIEGPAPWLDHSVVSLPEGTALLGNVPAVSNDKLQISLSAQSVQPPEDPKALDWLRRQLMWSLKPNLSSVLELRIGNQEQTDYDGSDYLTSNPTYRLSDPPERFVVYEGKIRRMSRSPGATDAIPVIRPEANRNVRAAAIAHGVGQSPGSRRYAALVTVENNRQVLRVGSAPLGEQAGLHRVELRGGSTGQPVWAISSDDAQTGAIGLITIGGRLYSFSADGSPIRQVPLAGPTGFISAVAAAPDGRRIALAIGGKLYMAALNTSADGPQLSDVSQVQVPALRLVSAVDWGTETSLIVAGTRADKNRVAIIDTTIDGTQYNELKPDIGTDAVTYLAAYPVSPVSSKGSPDVVQYMANGAAFDALSGPGRIEVNDLAEPVPDPVPGVAPVAPFFLR
ncbi:LpqB family beta-propeller domain-containing protein [Actinoplanes sp. NPDC051346]|uniref:LpqB family beta-propeller domain-containing protein n=1 Tax=Actinoplanes sp. NPDC051346 TaxID=3155048 RepID=UPI00342A4B01